jgi:hypothetical protein
MVGYMNLSGGCDLSQEGQERLGDHDAVEQAG